MQQTNVFRKMNKFLSSILILNSLLCFSQNNDDLFEKFKPLRWYYNSKNNIFEMKYHKLIYRIKEDVFYCSISPEGDTISNELSETKIFYFDSLNRIIHYYIEKEGYNRNGGRIHDQVYKYCNNNKIENVYTQGLHLKNKLPFEFDENLCINLDGVTTFNYEPQNNRVTVLVNSYYPTMFQQKQSLDSCYYGYYEVDRDANFYYLTYINRFDYDCCLHSIDSLSKKYHPYTEEYIFDYNGYIIEYRKFEHERKSEYKKYQSWDYSNMNTDRLLTNEKDSVYVKVGHMSNKITNTRDFTYKFDDNGLWIEKCVNENHYNENNHYENYSRLIVHKRNIIYL